MLRNNFFLLVDLGLPEILFNGVLVSAILGTILNYETFQLLPSLGEREVSNNLNRLSLQSQHYVLETLHMVSQKHFSMYLGTVLNFEITSKTRFKL